MRVKVKYKDILAETAKAVLLLVSESEIWFPKSQITWGKGAFVVCQKSLAEAKGCRYTTWQHIPDVIEPVYNQEPLDELRFNPQ